MKKYTVTLNDEMDNYITWASYTLQLSREDAVKRAFALFLAALKADEVYLVTNGEKQLVKLK